MPVNRTEKLEQSYLRSEDAQEHPGGMNSIENGVDGSRHSGRDPYRIGNQPGGSVARI